MSVHSRALAEDIIKCLIVDWLPARFDVVVVIDAPRFHSLVDALDAIGRDTAVRIAVEHGALRIPPLTDAITGEARKCFRQLRPALPSNNRAHVADALRLCAEKKGK